MINIAMVDQYVSEQGRFCLIDWLLSDNLLFYGDYESWRYGKLETLEGVLQIAENYLDKLLSETNKHCQNLGLEAEGQKYFGWQKDAQQLLMASKDPIVHQHLTQLWRRSQDQPQLDLFMDNSAQIMEHRLLDALTDRQFQAAQQHLIEFSDLNPESKRSGGYQDLINYGLHIESDPYIPQEALLAEWQGLKQEVVLLAQDVLGIVARDYLSFAWRRLANNMSGLAFNSQQPQLHVSSALLEIPDHAMVVEKLTEDKDLYSQPILILRLAKSYAALHQEEKALMAWCLLMELDNDFCEAELDANNSLSVHSIWQDFWEVNEEWPGELFPGYLLIKTPALIHIIEEFPKFQNSSTLAIIDLLNLRLNQESEINARKKLQEISPELLNVYLDS